MSCLKEVIYVDIQELEKSPDNKIVKEGPGFKHSRALQHHLVKGNLAKFFTTKFMVT